LLLTVFDIQSGGGPPQSRTLARIPAAHEWREASWSAPALWRFGFVTARTKELRAAQAASCAAVKKTQFDGAHFRRDLAAKAL
jgi:hypothetical protein